MIIVAWSTKEAMGALRDHWTAHESMEEAQQAYVHLQSNPKLYSASIAGVIKSTDYDPYVAPDVQA